MDYSLGRAPRVDAYSYQNYFEDEPTGPSWIESLSFGKVVLQEKQPLFCCATPTRDKDDCAPVRCLVARLSEAEDFAALGRQPPQADDVVSLEGNLQMDQLLGNPSTKGTLKGEMMQQIPETPAKLGSDKGTLEASPTYEQPTLVDPSATASSSTQVVDWRQKDWFGVECKDTSDGKIERHLADGRVYIGEWNEAGWPEGEGRLTKPGPEAGTFTGQWVSGRLHGLGEFKSSKDKSGYQGEWKNGMPHGKGVETWANGTHYTGNFRSGRPHGGGTITLPSGMIRRVL
eukprot:TRINITY_DN34340_c0_g1_i1.p1 TRINITY_DN34340_c0_g1~~TRINITY_DN34340_c0_g1_i1.p1  ORF type:complete len:287 (+),score=46.73 TRINITY_DN34340_c0_g1_i1:77-937(+)